MIRFRKSPRDKGNRQSRSVKEKLIDSIEANWILIGFDLCFGFGFFLATFLPFSAKVLVSGSRLSFSIDLKSPFSVANFGLSMEQKEMSPQLTSGVGQSP